MKIMYDREETDYPDMMRRRYIDDNPGDILPPFPIDDYMATRSYEMVFNGEYYGKRGNRMMNIPGVMI